MRTEDSVNKEEELRKWGVADYFSRHARFWKLIYSENQDEIDRFYSFEIRNRKEAVLGIVRNQAVDAMMTVLDAGCGSGVFVAEMLPFVHAVVGMDISTEMLRETRGIMDGYPDARSLCVQGDIERLPFRSDSFDAVLCVGVLSYAADDGRSIAEMRRVCKSGGRIVLSVPNRLRISALLDPYCWIKQMQLRLKGLPHGDDNRRLSPGPATHEPLTEMKRYRLLSLAKMFRHYHLDMSDVIGIGFGPVSFRKRTVLPADVSIRISRFFESLSRTKAFRFLNHLANHFVICLEKR